MDILKVEEMLKKLTIKDAASRLEMTADSLTYHLKMAGTDVVQIKDDYARVVLSDLSGRFSFPEMSAITGFSLTKIKSYRKLGIVKSNAKGRGRIQPIE